MMKKKISLLFILLLTMCFIGVSTIKTNAMNLEVVYTDTFEDGSGKSEYKFIDDEQVQIVVINESNVIQGEPKIAKYVKVNETTINILNKDGEPTLTVTFNEETKSAKTEIYIAPVEPIEPIEPIKPVEPEEPEEPYDPDNDLPKPIKWLQDCIVAFVVALLGNGFFLSLVKLFTNKGTNLLKKKIRELTEQNKIATDTALKYNDKIDELQGKVNEVLAKNNELLDDLREKLDVDKEKEEQISKLLDDLLPKLEEEEGVENGKEKTN